MDKREPEVSRKMAMLSSGSQPCVLLQICPCQSKKQIRGFYVLETSRQQTLRTLKAISKMRFEGTDSAD